MIHIFSDTDILLDLVTGRLPYSVMASSLFTLVEEGQIRSSASSLSFSNIYYVLRKYATHQRILNTLTRLSELLHIQKVDESIIKDYFIDELNNFFALSDPDIGVIITRNIKDYKAAELPVMTPETFLKTYLHVS